jgi:hypothetical protein
MIASLVFGDVCATATRNFVSVDSRAMEEVVSNDDFCVHHDSNSAIPLAA